MFLIDNCNETTDILVEQIITALNDIGNDFIKNYSNETFREEVETLEKISNYYLSMVKCSSCFKSFNMPTENDFIVRII